MFVKFMNLEKKTFKSSMNLKKTILNMIQKINTSTTL